MKAAIDADRLVSQLSDSFERTAREVVPWFVAEMPPAYFRDTDAETQQSHLRAIIAARASATPLRITLRSHDGERFTFINERDYPGLLAELMDQLPADRPLRYANVHGTPGGHLVLDTFHLGTTPKVDPANPGDKQRIDAILDLARSELAPAELGALRRHLEGVSADYLRTVSPRRILSTYQLHRQVSGTDDTVVALGPATDPSCSRIVFVVGNATPRRIFQRIAAIFGARGVDIRDAYLDVFTDPPSGFVSALSYVVQGPGQTPIDPNSELWRSLSAELLRAKWLSDPVWELDRTSRIGWRRAEVAIALASLAHQILVRENPYAFARDRILGLPKKHPEIFAELADLFLARFDPERPLSDEELDRRLTDADERADRALDRESDRKIVDTVVRAIRATLRTNAHLDKRYGLALRLDPELMPKIGAGERPFGVFFVHARGFDGFHVRFRDIARGGVRVVTSRSPEQYVLEADRLFDEAYGLAQAQQLKNKDIPEGGAKGVIVITPGFSVARAVKGFTDGLLDLITPDPAVARRRVDRLGRDEVLYLGPDENITPEHIEWIVDRAHRRGYPMANAFMSSKPGAGINHKEYGVTSEGVNVFLELALAEVGIDPRRQPFTVKITGGPDGDVAGNEIKILFREYGDNAKIVGIADGSGSAEDPDGLSRAGLLALVEASKPIADLDPRLLGPRGVLTPLSHPEGMKRRNSLHHRVIADAFIPAGGRPQTIHAGNCREFLQPDGTPSSKVIVEGANLFITPEAREELTKLGVLVLKDSSANKCGVICSSFEIGASMVVSPQEFLEFKPVFVQQVLARLRDLARREAEVLFREHRRNKALSLPKLSVRLSEVVNRARDAIARHYDGLDPAARERTRSIVIDHLPAVLVERAGARLFERLPPAYVRAIVASALAADMIYREGLGWLDGLDDAAIGALAFRYRAESETVARLAKTLRSSSLADRDVLVQVVERTGIRALVS